MKGISKKEKCEYYEINFCFLGHKLYNNSKTNFYLENIYHDAFVYRDRPGDLHSFSVST